MINRKTLEKLRHGADVLRESTISPLPPGDHLEIPTARIPYAALQAKLDFIDEEHSKRCKDLHQQALLAIQRTSRFFDDLWALYEETQETSNPKNPESQRHESTQTIEKPEISLVECDSTTADDSEGEVIGHDQLEWVLRHAEDVRLHLSSALRQGKTLYNAALALENITHSGHPPVPYPLTQLIEEAAVGLSDIRNWMNQYCLENENSLANSHLLQYPSVIEPMTSKCDHV